MKIICLLQEMKLVPGDEARPRISSNVAVYAEAQLTYSLWGRTVLNHNKTVLGFHCSFTVIP